MLVSVLFSVFRHFESGQDFVDDESYYAYAGVISVSGGAELTCRWWQVQKSHGAMDEGFVKHVDQMFKEAPSTTFYDNIDKWYT